MKIVLMILGVLLLVGGLAVGALMATSDLAAEAQEDYQMTLKDLDKAEKELELAKGSFDEPEKLKKAELWRKNADAASEAVSTRNRDRIFGFIGSFVLIVLGLGLFGSSFFFHRKKQ